MNSFDPKVVELLSEYSWPGNIRQLRNVIYHSRIMAERAVLRLSDVPRLEAPIASTKLFHRMTLAEIEREAILETLEATGGNKTEAARWLGVTARTLFNKLASYGDGHAA